MDQIARMYNFNDNANMTLNEEVKNALDPKGILATEKNGIWPATYDKQAWIIKGPETPTDAVLKSRNVIEDSKP